jgi:ABC-type nitrate/sulfonate/bicarbonate transport system permease component
MRYLPLIAFLPVIYVWFRTRGQRQAVDPFPDTDDNVW